MDTMMKTLKEMSPDSVIVCSADPALPTVDLGGIEIVAQTIKRIRLEMPDVKIFGYGLSFALNSAMESLVDFPILSYAEQALPIFEPGLGRLLFRSNFLDEQTLSSLPPLDVEKIGAFQQVHGTNFDYVMASRGCSYKQCVFCLNASSLLGAPYVIRSPESFALDVKTRQAKLLLDYFYFADMSFFSHTEEYLQALAKEFTEWQFKFTCEARVHEVTPKKLDLMKQFGLRTVKLGVEGASDELLTLYKKGTTVAEVKEKVQMIHDFGLRVVVYLLLGHPKATKEMYSEALSTAVSLDGDYYVINVACPYIGTPLWEICDTDRLRKMGLIRDGIEFGFTHLSHDLLDFWGIPLDLFESYMLLSGTRKKEDEAVAGVKRYVRKIL